MYNELLKGIRKQHTINGEWEELRKQGVVRRGGGET